MSTITSQLCFQKNSVLFDAHTSEQGEGRSPRLVKGLGCSYAGGAVKAEEVANGSSLQKHSEPLLYFKGKLVHNAGNSKPTPCLPQSASPKLKQHMLEMPLPMIQKMFKEHNISNEARNTVGTKQARLTPIAQGCQDGKPINIWQ